MIGMWWSTEDREVARLACWVGRVCRVSWPSGFTSISFGRSGKPYNFTTLQLHTFDNSNVHSNLSSSSVPISLANNYGNQTSPTRGSCLVPRIISILWCGG